MDGVEEKTETFMDSALRMNVNSKDLLQKFKNLNQFRNENERKREDEVEEIELGLGLSTNGRFGIDPTRKKLKRSVSISNLVFSDASADNDSGRQARAPPSESHAPLVRACSLPTETDVWRRLKDIQSMRCMEARKKRMEKLKSVEVINIEDSSSEDARDESALPPHFCGSINAQSFDNGAVGGFEKSNRMLSSQGSIGSSRSGSSTNSDLQSKLMEGGKLNAAMKSKYGIQAPREPGMQQPPLVPADTDGKGDKEVLTNALLDMPHVSTRGCGLNRIEGFLYRYKKGEDITIVCVCHGMFLSPAEFVKHGGGGDVENPLKHIVVTPFPLM